MPDLEVKCGWCDKIMTAGRKLLCFGKLQSSHSICPDCKAKLMGGSK